MQEEPTTLKKALALLGDPGLVLGLTFLFSVVITASAILVLTEVSLDKSNPDYMPKLIQPVEPTHGEP